jgi:hypothetical protein
MLMVGARSVGGVLGYTRTLGTQSLEKELILRIVPRTLGTIGDPDK